MKLRLELPPLWRNPRAESDQYRAINDPARISLAATGTKVGKTLGASKWITEKSVLYPGTLWWWIAPYRRTGKIGWKRILSLLPPELISHIDNTELALQLINGSRIEIRSAEIPDALFGEAVSGAVVDEGGRVREASWNAVYSTLLQTQGPIRILGNTDRGRRNWFYRLFIEGKAGTGEVSSHHIRSLDAPHFMTGGNPGPEALERMRGNLSDLAYRSLVLAEFPEDAATVFPGLNMALLDAVDAGPAPRLYPAAQGRRYVAGLDVGNRRNYSVLTIAEVETRRVVYWERYRDTSWTDQIRRVASACKEYDAIVSVDATHGSVGDPIFEDLVKAGVRAIPFKFTGQSKAPLIEALTIAIERREILIPRSLTVLISELEAFEREITLAGNVKYHSPKDDEEIHDDAVISLALANWELRGYPRERKKPSEVPKVSAKRNQETRRVRGGAKRKGFL